MASHIFSVQSFREYVGLVFAQKLDLLDEKLRKSVRSGAPLDLAECFFQFTLDSFCKIGFGTDAGALQSEVPIAFVTAFDEAQKIADARFFTPAWRLVEELTDTGTSGALNWQVIS